jgi:hypothetical protein
MQRTDILGDGDELAVGLRLADATELTLGAFVDHNDLSAVTDFTVLADALDKVVDGARENIDPGTRFVDMNPADARSWIEYGLRRGEYLPRSDQWREAQPLVRWAIAQLPDGGTAYERPEWDDDAVAELLNGFFASSAGAPFTGVEYRDFRAAALRYGLRRPVAMERSADLGRPAISVSRSLRPTRDRVGRPRPSACIRSIRSRAHWRSPRSYRQSDCEDRRVESPLQARASPRRY